jgi:hypothetical protein
MGFESITGPMASLEVSLLGEHHPNGFYGPENLYVFGNLFVFLKNLIILTILRNL